MKRGSACGSVGIGGIGRRGVPSSAFTGFEHVEGFAECGDGFVEDGDYPVKAGYGVGAVSPFVGFLQGFFDVGAGVVDGA